MTFWVEGSLAEKVQNLQFILYQYVGTVFNISLLYPLQNLRALDEKYRFSKTGTLLKLYGNLELKFPV